MTVRRGYEEQYLIVLTGRTDLRAGDLFEHFGEQFVAITDPVGATQGIHGVTVPLGMVIDPEHTLPPGAITARKATEQEKRTHELA